MTKHKMHLVRKNVVPLIFILMTVFISCKQGSGEKVEKAQASVKEDGAISNDSPYIVDVTAADFAFGMPTKVPSGWVTFRMNNMGNEEHLGIISSYPESLAYEEIVQLISKALEEEGIEKFMAIRDQAEQEHGGPALLSPGFVGETTVYLEPGVYTLTCWVTASDGQPHFKKGMIRPFIVSGETTGAEKPQTTVEITMSGIGMDIPDSVKSGEHIFNVSYEDSRSLHLVRLTPEQNVDDLTEWFDLIQAPSPYEFLGGALRAPEGSSSTFKATLDTGRYYFVTYGPEVIVEELQVTKDRS